ncbi:MAG: AzlD domain-containing protein [Rhizobiaceae bacterium]
MYFNSFDSALWPYFFILMAGVLPTAIWRWIGVVLVGNIDDDSEWLVLVRCVATALVAAVIAQLIFQPTGALATFPFEIRVGAALIGFAAFLMLGRKLFVAILVSEVVLLAGYALF